MAATAEAPPAARTCKWGHKGTVGRPCVGCANRIRRARDNKRAGRHPREVLVKVPNAPLRERLLDLIAAGRITVAQAAVNAGWRTGRGGGDTLRMKRTLGLVPSNDGTRRDGTRYTTVRETIDYETAVRLCHALHAHPADMGI